MVVKTAPNHQHDVAIPFQRKRIAEWLGSLYESHEWKIFDTHGGDDGDILSFRMRMPDGRCFTEWSEFYAAVKEFAFLFRDERYSTVADAQVHVAAVQSLMAICHGLALDGFTSFKHVNAKVIEVFLKRVALGNNGILKASIRLEAWLKQRDKGQRLGFHFGLPMRMGSDGKYNKRLDSAKLMGLVGLPDSACQLTAVVYLCNRECRKAGFYGRDVANEKPPVVATISVQAVYRYLSVLEILYLMRGQISATSLAERPFANASELSKQLGTATKPTPIPPVALTLHLVSQAIIWVSNYSDALIMLWSAASEIPDEKRSERHRFESAIAEIASQYADKGPQGSPWPLSEKAVKFDGNSLSCQAAVRLLFTACFIVVGTFSARRKKEILSLNDEDIRGSGEDGWELRPFIRKTLQRKDWIPVPPVVAKAMSVLSKLSMSAQQEMGNSALFQWVNPFLVHPVVMTSVVEANDAIDEFARWVGTPHWSLPQQDPEEWHWTPHQFRKFFAVLYFYRYRGATIEVLAHFLRHFNLEMTRMYLTLDPETKKLFDEVEWGFTKQVARSIGEKGEAAIGGMAKRLAKQWIDRLRQGVRVTSTVLEQAEDYVARQIKRNKLVLTPKAWVDCSCPRTEEAAKSASCRQGLVRESGDVGPNFSNAGPSVCIDCPYSIDNGRLEESLAEERLNAQRAEADSLLEGTIIHELLRERVIKIHRYQVSADV